MDIVNQSVNDSVVVCVTPSHTAGSPASIGTAMGRPWTKQMRFASGRTYRLSDYPLKCKMSFWKLVGLPKYLYENDLSGNFAGTYNASPPATLPWVVNIETGDNSTLAAPLEISVRITYWVKCYSPETNTLAGPPPRVLPENCIRLPACVVAKNNGDLSVDELARQFESVTVAEDRKHGLIVAPSERSTGKGCVPL